MRRALDLADQAETCVLPNPRVGAVIVHENQIVGEGYHRGPGNPHAEVEAIKDAEAKNFKDFSRAELFVTLEPCCHTNKRTPPCAPLLVQKKFKRLIVACLDPNPNVSGKGIELVKKSGIQVEVGCLENESILLNQPFIKNQLEKSPYITLKIATSFDGKMADDFGKSKWITGEESRADTQLLRRRVDAIGVGKNTIENDNPSLNVRVAGEAPQARKILIFGKPKNLNKRSKVIQSNTLENIFLIGSKKSLKKTLSNFYRDQGICHILIEGGPGLASSLLKEGLIDEIVHYQGRGYLGGKGQYSLGRAWGLARLSKCISFAPKDVKLIGTDLRIQGFLHVYRPDSKSGKRS